MRLYKMEIITQPKLTRSAVGHLVPVVNNEEWFLFCHERFDKVVDYFNPSQDRLYKSRSSALDKVRIVEFYGGEAQILEAEVSPFLPVTEMNALRKRRRDNVRIAKLRAKIDQIASQS